MPSVLATLRLRSSLISFLINRCSCAARLTVSCGSGHRGMPDRSVMILLFPRKLAGTLIVVISIPLSILSSIIFSASSRDTQHHDARRAGASSRNVVDDATVEIENTHRNIEMGKPY